MVPATHTAHNIETTAESLQGDLARLELQKRALERELAAVVAHLDSVQRALSALSVLMSDSPGATQSATTGNTDRHHAAQTVQEVAPSRAAEPPSDDTAPAESQGGREERASRAADAPRSKAPEQQQQYGQLTEQIIEYFTHIADKEVRARDVAAALGRDTDSGAINAVRSTLDRLVGTSRIQRAGRGLYRAG
ncbi:hypothetical protein C6Y14_41120 [Streptomyces dioscori]|uniref:Uncharacterized protein n=1 Tax=Streptomyces dioscori TaxID=2109333 RepID=A0A2P8PU72_9ACTN|nr:hypothetical protein [Streptomyces dioscori]PSM37576.1 hypothetical protein C6Y14_41120 [Streptomyces dioscori]